jgi:hypothetical protein
MTEAVLPRSPSWQRRRGGVRWGQVLQVPDSELKRTGVTYGELAGLLAKHGLKKETADSIKLKLARVTFAATFLLATLAALEMEGVKLEDI